jgi:methionyl-tRNA formyltransferase
MKIALLVDSPASWFMPYARRLEKDIAERGHAVSLVNEAESIPPGDCAFFLSCVKLVPAGIRTRNTHNIVVHSSALPQGKGWSPLTWQVLEGKDHIPTSLFEAVDAVDAGPVYARAKITLEGHELLDELHEKQAGVIADLALRFIEAYPSGAGEPQQGSGSSYRRRTPEDSELDPEKTIIEQFDMFRVVDNENYPAFFKHRGHTYVLKIYKKDNPKNND